jgi:hypothetical protein
MCSSGLAAKPLMSQRLADMHQDISARGDPVRIPFAWRGNVKGAHVAYRFSPTEKAAGRNFRLSAAVIAFHWAQRQILQRRDSGSFFVM